MPISAGSLRATGNCTLNCKYDNLIEFRRSWFRRTARDFELGGLASTFRVILMDENKSQRWFRTPPRSVSVISSAISSLQTVNAIARKRRAEFLYSRDSSSARADRPARKCRANTDRWPLTVLVIADEKSVQRRTRWKIPSWRRGITRLHDASFLPGTNFSLLNLTFARAFSHRLSPPPPSR